MWVDGTSKAQDLEELEWLGDRQVKSRKMGDSVKKFRPNTMEALVCLA